MMMTTSLSICMIAATCGLSGCSHLSTQPSRFDRALASAAESGNPDLSFDRVNEIAWSRDAAQIKKVWANRHCDSHQSICSLGECDLLGPEINSNRNCRRDTVLVFRGEEQRFLRPATSDLERTRLSGVTLNGERNSGALVASLDREIGKIRGIDYSFFLDVRGTCLISKRDHIHSYGWYYGDNASQALPQKDLDPSRFTSAEFAFLAHETNLRTFVETADHRRFSLDPFVSFSLSPVVAESFLSPTNEGRVIVLSIPSDEIFRHCGKIGDPGTLVSFQGCTGSRYTDEVEIDAVIQLGRAAQNLDSRRPLRDPSMMLESRTPTFWCGTCGVDHGGQAG